MRSMVAAVVVVTCLTMGVVSARQFPTPPGWEWITDADAKIITALDPPEGSWLFGTMAPGWHITTRPGATLYEPSHTGRGRFAIESEIFLFPGTSDSGFGLFIGGQELEAKGRLVAFLIRRDGSAAVESRESGRNTQLRPWTKATPILPGAATGDPVKNVLRVEAEATTVVFAVNGQQVLEIPREGTALDGIVGLRVGSDLNLHVTNLDVTHRLALPRRAKQQ
jgi:hypothetical protein